MKFTYGQRVRITQDGFYKGKTGLVMGWMGRKDGKEWYNVMIQLPDTVSAQHHKPPYEDFTGDDMEAIV